MESLKTPAGIVGISAGVIALGAAGYAYKTCSDLQLNLHKMEELIKTLATGDDVKRQLLAMASSSGKTVNDLKDELGELRRKVDATLEDFEGRFEVLVDVLAAKEIDVTFNQSQRRRGGRRGRQVSFRDDDDDDDASTILQHRRRNG